MPKEPIIKTIPMAKIIQEDPTNDKDNSMEASAEEDFVEAKLKQNMSKILDLNSQLKEEELPRHEKSIIKHLTNKKRTLSPI